MDEIEYDEELQLIFASSPNKFIRNGNGVIFLLLLIILSLSIFIKYPETISGTVSLYISPSSASIVSKSSGRVVLLFKNGQNIKKNTLIGYINNPASLKDVLYFSRFIDSITNQISKGKDLSAPKLNATLNLGEVQPYYVSLLNSLNVNSQHKRYNNFQPQKKDIEEQITSNIKLRSKQLANLKVASSELVLMEKKFKRDSTLFEKKVISLAEFESSKLSFLPFKRAYESLNQNILSTDGIISSLSYKNKTLDNENGQSLAETQDNLKSAILSAKGQTDLWKDRYLIISPITGTVSLVNSWNTFQNIKIGDEIMSVIPQKQGVIAKATILVAGSGKMKYNDEAIISLDDFSPEEFGTIKANIQVLPSIQSGGQYVVILKLPDGLVTNFRKKIVLKEGMTGSIKVITNNISLINHLFFQLKKALNNS